MDLVGDEKKIQALFSELSLEDQNSVPRFEEVWSGARIVGPAPVRRFSTPAVRIAVALLVVAACLLAAWSWYRSTRSSSQTAAELVQPTSPTSPSQPAQESPAQGFDDRESAAAKTRPRPKHRKNRARLQPTERAAIYDAALLSRWQSPTQLFLASPAGLALNSLPQLNQSAEQLKGFLPKNNQPTKESNQ